MPRKKLKRFAYNLTAPNVITVEKEGYMDMKSRWNEQYFKNANPIVLELACGNGEYTVGLAEVFPNKNFIGIDVKGDRIAVGSQIAISKNLTNVAFLKTNIYFLESFFAKNEVSEIWITFPDPFNKKEKRERNRLTHIHFLEIYKKIIRIGGEVHLKTDNEELFDFSIEELNRIGVNDLVFTHDLNNSTLKEGHFGIKTRFEKIFTDKGFSVHYLKCKFN